MARTNRGRAALEELAPMAVDGAAPAHLPGATPAAAAVTSSNAADAGGSAPKYRVADEDPTKASHPGNRARTRTTTLSAQHQARRLSIHGGSRDQKWQASEMQALQQLAEAGDAPPGRAMRKMSSSATAPGTATAHWNKGVIFTKNAVQFGHLQSEVKALYGSAEAEEGGGDAATGRGDDGALRHTLCCRTLLPDCAFRQAWDITQVVLLMWVSVVVPLRVGFDLTLEPFIAQWWFEVCVDLYFMSDVWLNFRTGYVDEQFKVLIMDRKKIAAQYLRGWFLLDVIACLPVGYLSLLAQGGGVGSTKAFKTVRLLRISKLMRLARMKRIVMRYAEMVEMLPIMGLLQILSVLTGASFIAHLTCCIWYFIGADGGWHASMDAAWAPYGEQTMPGDGGGAAQRGRLGTADIMARYWRTMFFAVGILVGGERGDIVPTTGLEMGFVIVVQLIGTLITSVIIGTVGTMIAQKNWIDEQVERNLEELKEYLEHKCIPHPTRRKVRRYMEHLYTKKTGYDERRVLEVLPPALSRELLGYLYKGQVMDVPLFRGLPSKVQYELCVGMKPLHVQRDDVVYREGEHGNELFVITEGRIALSRFNIELCQLGKGSFFGVEAVLAPAEDQKMTGARRDRTALALADTNMNFLERETLEAIGNSHPGLRKRIQTFSTKRMKDLSRKIRDISENAASSLGVRYDTNQLVSLLNVAHDAEEKSAWLETDTNSDTVAAAVTVQRWLRTLIMRKRTAMKIKLRQQRNQFARQGLDCVSQDLLESVQQLGEAMNETTGAETRRTASPPVSLPPEEASPPVAAPPACPPPLLQRTAAHEAGTSGEDDLDLQLASVNCAAPSLPVPSSTAAPAVAPDSHAEVMAALRELSSGLKRQSTSQEELRAEMHMLRRDVEFIRTRQRT